jgi:glycosyltransferase involved in cell wall biosynthesis
MTGEPHETAGLAAELGDLSLVSTFASHEGIARYAEQLASAIETRGVRVTRIGLAHYGAGGDLTVDLTRGTRFLRVVRAVPRRRAVLVMWHPTYLAGGRQLARIVAVGSLAVGFRLRRTIVVQHEPDDDLTSGVRGPRRLTRAFEERLRAAMWRGADEIWFHSAFERDIFRRRYRSAAASVPLRLVRHDQAPEIGISRAQARQRLGVAIDGEMFLCLGFLSIHKRVDRVLRAFAAAAPENGRLWIVGEAITSNVETRGHIDELHRVAAQTANVELRETYVDDAEFDTWLRAADFVVTAYQTAATSGVIPRAQLMGARIIGSGAGGTAEQMRPGLDVVASDYESLVGAFRDVRSSHAR